MEMNRRDFLRGMGAAGAGMMVFNQTSGLFAQNANPAATPANSNINVALIGAGTQGRILAECIRKIPGINFKAICDIWEYNRNYTAKRIKAYTKKTVNAYIDYKEMLEKEQDLDAVVIATPDCYHAEHAIACLKAGKHVYCEKEMSHKLELAAEMVKTSNETGKLLQIGHQRRSNPVYQYAYKMIHEDKMCGRLTALYGQWNRTPEDLLAWPAGKEVPEDILKKYGYENMEQFKNWRWFKKYSGGPIADLGSHQIDIFSWFLNAEPYAVTAFGGADYFPNREWYEDVTVMYDYKTTFDGKPGSARSYYQVLNTSGWQEYYERFAGDRGTINLSENPKNCFYIPGSNVEIPKWMEGIEQMTLGGGVQAIPLIPALKNRGDDYKAVMEDFEQKQGHHLHLENFFAAVAKNDKKMLNCPGEVGYDTCVTVLSVIPAVEKGGLKIR